MVGRHLLEQRRRHERRDDQSIAQLAVVRERVAEDVVGEQPPQLVTADAPPRAVGLRDRRPEPVGVGIVGEGDRRAPLRGERDDEIHRAGLLRVGELHRREVGVGSELLLHDERHREARRLEGAADELTADSVHRRVGDGDAGRVRPPAGACGVGDVPVDDRLVEPLDQRIVLVRQRHRGRLDLLDAGRDASVMRRHDLRTVAQVHLVPVVGRRVVRRRHHHSGRPVELGQDPCQHRSGQGPRQQSGRDPVGGHDPGGVEGEDVALAAGVEADHHAPRSGPLVDIEHIRRQAGGGLAHHQPVHPQRAGPNGGAQSGGAEREVAGEPGLQLGVGAGEQIAQLGLDVGIRLGLQPALRRGAHVGHGNNVRSATRGRGPTWLITSAAAIDPSRAHSVSGSALLYP